MSKKKNKKQERTDKNRKNVDQEELQREWSAERMKKRAKEKVGKNNN